MRMRVALAVAAFVPALAAAQADSKPPAESKEAPKKLDKIEVQAPNETGERRSSTAAKIVVDHDEIMQYGDTNVLDVMKRLPGVTVSGAGGRGSEIRLRGLGNGYTQILVNGDPVPPGFSLETLNPDNIERVEIYRSATAEFSTQAIAGTINIVLRKAAPTRQREFKIGGSVENGAVGSNLTAQISDRSGSLSYTLPLGFNEFRFDEPETAEQVATDANGVPTQRYVTQIRTRGVGDAINFSPRLNWDFAKDHTLLWESFLFGNRFRREHVEHSETSLGPPPQFATSFWRPFHSDLTGLRSNVKWIRKLDNGARLEARLGLSYFHRASEAIQDAYDDAGVYVLHRTVEGHATDNGAVTSGKYTLPIVASHALSVGWDGATAKRLESRVQDDTTFTGLPENDIDESYDARVSRLALFGQDEWEITDRLSTYLGLRWEGIDIKSIGNLVQDVHSRFGVWSPIVQALWKLPGTEKDQVRAGIARTYKAPTVYQIIPRRYIVTNNTPTTPDYEGNPDLKPELSWGLDLAYEHYFGANGIFSVSAYGRRIQDVMASELIDRDGTFITRPANVGNAISRGIEMDAKFGSRTFWPSGPPLDLRANASRNWSRVDTIPGPNNRLDGQTRFSATAGFDYNPPAVPFTFGGSFSFKTGGPVRLSTTQGRYDYARRTLDFYGLWKFNPSAQLRLTAGNTLAQDYQTTTLYNDPSGSALQLTARTPTYIRVGAVLELKL